MTETAINRVSPVEVELSVTIGWPTVQTELDKQFRTLQQHAKLRGFRPGKVPRQMVRKIFGKRVETEVTLNLVQQALIQGLEQHHIDPVAEPDFEPPQIKEGKPLAFSATFEVNPEVKDVSLDGLAANRPTSGVDDAEVEAELERLREQQADLREPDPLRPVKASDVVTVSYEVSVDGQARDEFKTADREIDLSDAPIYAELKDGIIGAEVGKPFQVVLKLSGEDQELAGKEASFHVEVKSLREKVLPELDEEFAKDVGHDSLDAMKTALRQGIQHSKQERAEEALRSELVDRLLELNPVSLPPKLVEKHIRQSEDEILSVFGGQAKREEILGRFGDGLRSRSEHKLHAGLLFRALAQRHELSANEEEVSKKIEEFAASSGQHPAKIRAQYQGEAATRLQAAIVEEKVFDLLKQHATITDVEPERAETGEASQPST